MKGQAILVFQPLAFGSQRLFPLFPTKGKVPKEDILKRKSFYGPGSYAMCLEEEKSNEHLLLYC